MPFGEDTGPCGATLDDIYTCTKDTTDMTHIAQHHDEINDVMWKNAREFYSMF